MGAAGPKNAENIIVSSFAFGNVSKGFDQNHNIMGLTVLNCTGYMNLSTFGNFAFQDAITGGTLGKHVLKNNLSIPHESTVLHTLVAGTEEVTNSWNLSLALTPSDFVSLDTSVATRPRNADYSIPNTGLFRLKSTNPAIDNGTPITYSFNGKSYTIGYNGSKPDLGAYEYTGGTSTTFNHSDRNSGIQLNVSPAKSFTFVTLTGKNRAFSNGVATIFNNAGIVINKIPFVHATTGQSTFRWNYDNASGYGVANGKYAVKIVVNSAARATEKYATVINKY